MCSQLCKSVNTVVLSNIALFVRASWLARRSDIGSTNGVSLGQDYTLVPLMADCYHTFLIVELTLSIKMFALCTYNFKDILQVI